MTAPVEARMSGERPKTSVIVPWCARPEIERTLGHNVEILAGSAAEIVVSCAGDDAYLRGVRARLPTDVAVRVVSYCDAPFNKARSVNIGAAHARGDSLMVLDADVLLEEDTLADLRGGATPLRFCTIERVSESDAEVEPGDSGVSEFARYLEFVDSEGVVVRIETNRVRFSDGSRAGPGLILVDRAHFLAVGGMNSQLAGWGWEDLDLIARLSFVLGLQRAQAGSAVHVSHGDDVRVFRGRSRNQSELINFDLAAQSYQERRYEGTFAADASRDVTEC